MSSPSIFIFSLFSFFFWGDAALGQNEGQSYRGDWKVIDTPDSYEFRAWVTRHDADKSKWLILFHDWTGINASTMRTAEDYADRFSEFNVICPDLFDGRANTSNYSSQAENDSIQHERYRQIIYGLQKYVGFRSDVAVVGWSSGGYWAMESCALFSKPPFACVNFYGEPVSHEELLLTIETPMLHIFTRDEKHVSGSCVEVFESNVVEYKLDTEIIKIDCSTDFNNHLLPDYDKKTDRLSRKEAFDFIERSLGPL